MSQVSRSGPKASEDHGAGPDSSAAPIGCREMGDRVLERLVP